MEDNKEQEITPEETVAKEQNLPAEESAPESENAENVPAFEEGFSEEDAEIDPEEAARQEELRRIAEAEKRKFYGKKSKVTGFVFFGFTFIVFFLYVYFCALFLYTPLLNSPENLGEALAAVFGYLFGFIFTFAFAILQLPENIVAIILFQRLRKGVENKKEKKLYTAFFAISLSMLLFTLLSLAVFLIVVAVG